MFGIRQNEFVASKTPGEHQKAQTRGWRVCGGSPDVPAGCEGRGLEKGRGEMEAGTWDSESEEERIMAEYNERFQPHEYRNVFYPPVSGEGRIDALFMEGFFESAKLLLKGVTTGELREGIEGVAAVFLSRHYLELALKYTLFHSRWLRDETHNATDVKPVGRGHNLHDLWENLTAELKTKPTAVPKGLDMDFVAKFVEEFHDCDPANWRFRYAGKQLPVVHSSHEALGIDFDSLLFNLQRAYDVLDTLDKHLVNTYGENQEWQDEQNSW